MDKKIEELASFLKKGSKIHIKKSQRGSFTSYCGGKVTNECIQRGKNSPDPKIRKKATFAANARTWKHDEGGKINSFNTFNVAKQVYNTKFYQRGGDLAYTPFSPSYSNIVQPTISSNKDKLNDFIKRLNQFQNPKQTATQFPNQTYIPFLPKGEQVSTLPDDYEPSFPVEPVKPVKVPSWKSIPSDSYVPKFDHVQKPEDEFEEDLKEENVAEQPKPNKSTTKDMNTSIVQQKEPQTNRERQIFANKYLQKNLNLTAEQAAALVGVWQAESGFNLNAENKAEKAGKNSAVKSSQYGIGIGQWTHSRHDDFVNFMKGKENTLKNQLDFAIHEIKTKYQDYLHNLQSAANIKDATAYTYVQYVGGNEKNIINVDDLYARVEKMVQRYMKKHMELYGKASNGFERRLKYAMDSLKLLS